MSKRRRCLLFAVLHLGLLGCSDIFRASYDYAHIEVAAVDQENGPVPGVRLTLYSGAFHLEKGVTRSDGRYTFRFVPAGGYGVEAGAPQGYRFPEDSAPYRLVQVAQGDRSAIGFEFVRPD